MAYATLADLLARCNTRRLFQLAVPADRTMPSDEALRVAVAGGDLSPFGAEVAETLGLALDTIAQALADAGDQVMARGIPPDFRSPLLARLTANIAFYYLQGAEKLTESAEKGYKAALAELAAHSRGDTNLVMPNASVVEDDVDIQARPYRPYSGAYGHPGLVSFEDWA